MTGLSDDLCLALKAESIRIDRIPGKAFVGIEVPNRERETIQLREVVESKKFRDSSSLLTIALLALGLVGMGLLVNEYFIAGVVLLILVAMLGAGAYIANFVRQTYLENLEAKLAAEARLIELKEIAADLLPVGLRGAVASHETPLETLKLIAQLAE